MDAPQQALASVHQTPEYANPRSCMTPHPTLSSQQQQPLQQLQIQLRLELHQQSEQELQQPSLPQLTRPQFASAIDVEALRKQAESDTGLLLYTMKRQKRKGVWNFVRLVRKEECREISRQDLTNEHASSAFCLLCNANMPFRVGKSKVPEHVNTYHPNELAAYESQKVQKDTGEGDPEVCNLEPSQPPSAIDVESLRKQAEADTGLLLYAMKRQKRKGVWNFVRLVRKEECREIPHEDLTNEHAKLAICLLCNATMSFRLGKSNVPEHVKAYHPNELAAYEAQIANKARGEGEPVGNLEPPQPTSSGLATASDNECAVIDVEALRKQAEADTGLMLYVMKRQRRRGVWHFARLVRNEECQEIPREDLTNEHAKLAFCLLCNATMSFRIGKSKVPEHMEANHSAELAAYEVQKVQKDCGEGEPVVCNLEPPQPTSSGFAAASDNECAVIDVEALRKQAEADTGLMLYVMKRQKRKGAWHFARLVRKEECREISLEDLTNEHANSAFCLLCNATMPFRIGKSKVPLHVEAYHPNELAAYEAQIALKDRGEGEPVIHNLFAQKDRRVGELRNLGAADQGKKRKLPVVTGTVNERKRANELLAEWDARHGKDVGFVEFVRFITEDLSGVSLTFPKRSKLR